MTLAEITCDLWKLCFNKFSQGNYQKTDIGGKS